MVGKWSGGEITKPDVGFKALIKWTSGGEDKCSVSTDGKVVTFRQKGQTYTGTLEDDPKTKGQMQGSKSTFPSRHSSNAMNRYQSSYIYTYMCQTRMSCILDSISCVTDARPVCTHAFENMVSIDARKEDAELE